MNVATHIPEVIIVDYGLGNLFSISQACQAVGLTTKISSDKKEIGSAQALILPGVGSFGEAMQNLEKLGLVQVLKDYVASGGPFMGICLGMQLLFTESEEFGNHKGLDLVKGKVKRFPDAATKTGEKLKVPQVSWNSISPLAGKTWQQTPLEQMPPGSMVYFVHSYYTEPEKEAVILAKTIYDGVSYCSAVLKDNIFAVQFHPEKSGPEGLKIYACWAKNIKQE